MWIVSFGFPGPMQDAVFMLTGRARLSDVGQGNGDWQDSHKG